MARIDWTSTFVDASGLRPTASAALIPIMPTAIAAPNAARPTVKFPFISIVLSERTTIQSRQAALIIVLFVCRLRLLTFGLANQKCEHRSQQHEDQRLDHTNKQLQKIERYRQQPAQAWYQIGHRVQHVLAGECIAVETETQGDWAEQNRNDLQAPNGEEHYSEHYLQQPAALPLGRKQLLQKSQRSIFAHGPEDPTSEEDQGHGHCHVDISIGAAEQGLIDFEAMRRHVPPTHSTDSWNEAYPIGAEYEDENSCKKPKRPFDQVWAKDSFKKTVEALNQPLQKILRTTWHLFHFPSCELHKND